ncbi:MAG TPA: hypothetical protein VF789_16505 [Thermoanaerobaculia bacterium]
MRLPKFFSYRILPFLLLLFVFAARPGTAQGSTPTLEAVCTNGSWSDCGVAVKQSIAALPDPLPADKVKRLIEIMSLWSDAYEKQVRFLESAGRLKKSENDWTKITNAVKEKIDPVGIAKEQGIDALLKKYLPKVAAFLEYASPVFSALSVFFDSSEIATDFDEINLMNKDLQTRFFNKMEPHLRSDWKTRIQTMSTEVMPQLRRP